MKKNEVLTEKEKQSIRVLNYVATYDGVITNDTDVEYLLQQGIKKFVSKKRQHLVSLTETAYPMRIKY